MKLDKKTLRLAAAGGILILAIVIALLVNALLPHENKNDFRVYFDDRSIVAYNDTVRDGIPYINALALAEYCELTVTGDFSQFKLISDSGSVALFTPDSNIALVGDVRVPMQGAAYYDKEILWLPCDFVNSHFDGVDIVINREDNKLSVYRVAAEGSTSDHPLYVDITFLTAGAVSGEDIDTDSLIASFSYMIDITPYLSSLSPRSDGYLLLVNKQNPLGDQYSPKKLTTLDTKLTMYGSEKQLEATAAEALSALMLEMRAAGHDNVFVTSAYRGYAYQAALFNTYINKEMASGLPYAEAKKKVLTYSAEPGTSEHQSGLCVDFITPDMADLDESFERQPVFAWLKENAHKFGFILRYPKEKESITGYTYEPWHYRFVGREAATEIYLSGDCLEQYLTREKQ